MFIYDKDKNISIFTRGKNGTTNFHNHYWMQKDETEVGSYTEFDQSKWLFATPLPAIEDMTRGCVNHNKMCHEQNQDDSYLQGNRRLGMYIFEYVSFLKTCKLLDLDMKHFIITRDPLERLASGLSTSLQNALEEAMIEHCGVTFDEINDNLKVTATSNYDDSFWNALCKNIFKLPSAQYHAQGWLSHIDKHINFEDYKVFSVDVNDLVPFAKEVVGIDVKETDKHLPASQWHGAHTGTRPPETRYFHNFIERWLKEKYGTNALDKQLTDLLDAEYKVVDKLTQIKYDTNT